MPSPYTRSAVHIRIGIMLLVLLSLSPSLFGQQQDIFALYSQRNYREAIAACERQIRANPSNMDAYVVLCWSLVQLNQYAEAERRATQARQINRYEHRIIEILAEAKFYLGKNTESLALFEEFLSLVPDSALRVGNAFYFMGEIYLRQGRYEHADIALTAATRLEPTLHYWWMRLGYAREMTQSYQASAAAYDRAITLEPLNTAARQGRQRIQSKL